MVFRILQSGGRKALHCSLRIEALESFLDVFMNEMCPLIVEDSFYCHDTGSSNVNFAKKVIESA